MYQLLQLLLLLTLTACNGQTIQTSTAPNYAAHSDSSPAATSKNLDIDQAVAKAAAVDPLLKFPARLGLARLPASNYGSYDIPPEEGADWIGFAKAHPDYGTFEEVSPLVIASFNGDSDATKSPLDRVRLAAARQHLDAVLVYSVDTSSSDTSSALSVFNLTVVGAFLMPSHRLKAQVTARAVLVDVRNGYPYGTATGIGAESGISPSIGSEDRVRTLTNEATLAAVKNLEGEVDTMMSRLRKSL